MKKILAALIITGMACFGANAQEHQMKVCKKSPDKVCRPSASNKATSCYNTHYAQSFDVCKNENGYYICCETPGEHNTTYSNAARALGQAMEEDVSIPVNANAGVQEGKMCGKNTSQVCSPSAGKKTNSCYNKTKYAQGYDVCKNEHGYYICCEPPAYNNTTYMRQR